MNEKRWVTLKDGRRIQIDTNKYMNDKIRNGTNIYHEADIEKYDEKSKKLLNEITEEEKLAITNYAGIVHKEINQTLGLGQPKQRIIYENVEDIKIDIGRIDNVMNKSIINENIITYRGDHVIDFSKYKVGDTIPIKSYTSTSFSERIALQRALNKIPQGNFIEIRVPKGTKGIYLGDNFTSTNEKELLLQRDINYKLISKNNVNDSNYGNYKKYIVEIVKK